MSFNPGNLVQWNVSPIPPNYGLPQWWGYLTTDTIATVSAADYFDLNPGNAIGRNTTWFIGDLLYCVCSDGVVQLEIATITPHVTTTASAAQIPAGSIVTAMIANSAVTTAKIADANVTLVKLSAGVAPEAVIKFSGYHTTTGGAAAEAIAIAGALATDGPFVQLVSGGTNVVSVVKAVMTNGVLTVTFSADPGADAIISYQVVRAAA
jgi:hypothetical protein